MWRQSPWPLSLHPISLPSLESSGLQWAQLGWGRCATSELRQSECALSVFVCFCCLLILLIFMVCFGFRLLSCCCVCGLCKTNFPVGTIHKSESLLSYLNIVFFLMYYHFHLVFVHLPLLPPTQHLTSDCKNKIVCTDLYFPLCVITLYHVMPFSLLFVLVFPF